MEFILLKLKLHPFKVELFTMEPKVFNIYKFLLYTPSFL